MHTTVSYTCELSIPFALIQYAGGHSVNKAIIVGKEGISSYPRAQVQFHEMVGLVIATRQAHETTLENGQQELVGELGPHRKRSLDMKDHTTEKSGAKTCTHSQYAQELEESVEAATSRMMNLNLREEIFPVHLCVLGKEVLLGLSLLPSSSLA